MDLIVRNARLAHMPEAAPADIGVVAGRIAAIEPRLQADVRSAGLVETHIHLTSPASSIARRRKAAGRLTLMQRVAAVYLLGRGRVARASRTLGNASSMAPRGCTHLELDGGVEMRSFRRSRRCGVTMPGVDLEVCVFPQEGLTDDALLWKGLKRSQGHRRGAELRSGSCRPNSSDLRSSIRYRHASRFRQFAG